jgi:hypothetical protein
MFPAADFQPGNFVFEQLFAGIVYKDDFVSDLEGAGRDITDNNGAIGAIASATIPGNVMYRLNIKPCALPIF